MEILSCFPHGLPFLRTEENSPPPPIVYIDSNLAEHIEKQVTELTTLTVCPLFSSHMNSFTQKPSSHKERMASYGFDSSTAEVMPENSPKMENGVASAAVPPLTSSYDYYIRPLLDAVDQLRQMKVMEEGIGLPTIVVVGDQSSGKSSVLESLAGISLPRGQGICTRVPLIMRLQNISTDEQELLLEYQGKSVPTTEEDIAEAITEATDDLAGKRKGISDTPLTLVVKKKGVPDLTMVDLPGITRIPVQDQPKDIYEQISSIIMEYIRPKESIILNVLSATVDFSTCESIRMSQEVDKTGERTLAVVTKVDRAPEGLLEKVTADDVKIGLGYVCVRNRIGEESYELARMEEAELFQSHPLLSHIPKSIAGVPVLAQKLVQIQASSICKCIPEVVKKINNKLAKNMEELDKMPKNFSSVPDAMQAFMRITGAAKESLKKVMIRGEFEEYPDNKYMHCTARMKEMLDKFAEGLKSKSGNDEVASNFTFLASEISVLEETKRIGLPNFLPRSAFLTVLQRQVSSIVDAPVEFVIDAMKYMEDVVLRIVSKHSKDYPQLLAVMRKAVHKLMDKIRERFVEHVKELIEMEKIADYTSNPDYEEAWSRLIENRKKVMDIVQTGYYQVTVNDGYGNYVRQLTQIQVEGIGEVEAAHLKKYKWSVVEQAFDMKMRLMAYWKLVLLRLVDAVALHLLFSVKNLVERELESQVADELLGSNPGGIERMLEESPGVSSKREKLNRSIKLLRESKDVVSKIMDRIAAGNEFMEGAF